MLHEPGHGHPDNNEGEHGPVCSRSLHLTELGAVAPAAVAAGVHSGTEKVGAGEASDEDRDEQAPDTAGPPFWAPLLARDATGGLCAGWGAFLLDKKWGEIRLEEHTTELQSR